MTIRAFLKKLKDKNISVFVSPKSSNILCIKTRVKNDALLVDEIKILLKNEEIEIWESFNNSNNSWYTFFKHIKNINIENEDLIIDVMDRDEVCDPDLLENWDEKAISSYGVNGLNYYKNHGFFPTQYDTKNTNRTSFWFQYLL